DVPEPTLPPEVEGGFAIGAAARLATPAFGRAMAQGPQCRSGAVAVRRLPQTESGYRGKHEDGYRQGSLVQAVPGLGGGEKREGAGSPGAIKSPDGFRPAGRRQHNGSVNKTTA